MSKLLHKLLHKHITPVAKDIGYLHFCTNRITKHTKVYFRSWNNTDPHNMDDWKEVSLKVAKRLMKADSPQNANMILFWNGLV